MEKFVRVGISTGSIVMACSGSDLPSTMKVLDQPSGFRLIPMWLQNHYCRIFSKYLRQDYGFCYVTQLLGRQPMFIESVAYKVVAREEMIYNTIHYFNKLVNLIQGLSQTDRYSIKR